MLTIKRLKKVFARKGNKVTASDENSAQGLKNKRLAAYDRERRDASINNPHRKSKSGNITQALNSVGFKLFIIICSSILACVLTVGLISYSEAKKMIETNVSNASLQTINQVAGNLDVVYQNYEDFTLQLFADKEFHELARNMTDSNDEQLRYESGRKLSDKFRALALSQKTVKGMMLLPLKEGLHVVASGSALSIKAEALKETDWFKKTIELDGKPQWIAPQAGGISYDSETPTIGLSRLLKDGASSDASYVLLLEMDADTFSGRYANVELGEGSEIFIVDSEGRYVLAGDAALIGQAVNVSLPTEGKDGANGAKKLKLQSGIEALTVYKTFNTMDWRIAATIPVEALIKDAETIRQLTWMTAIAAALIAIGIGVLVIYSIARPLVRMRDLMLLGADGNLTVRSALKKRRDEIGGLSDSFNRMMTQMSELAVQTTRSAEAVLSTASELTEASSKTSEAASDIAAATEEIAKGAANLAIEAEKGSTLTASMDTGMKNVVGASEAMQASARKVEQASVQGSAYMGMLIEKTHTTEGLTRSMVEKVDTLKESTGSIVKILDVLNSLTKQTNILSLNATIEAARAGAAGRGFMVVADEIRKLADQSRQSIDVVAQITGKIHGEIDETAKVLTEAYPMFQEQIESVKEANGIFLSVQEQMGQFVQGLHDVTNSVNDLERSQLILSEAMHSVSSVAEQSSATSEEVASLSSEQLGVSESLVSLSEELSNVSNALKETLSQFKI